MRAAQFECDSPQLSHEVSWLVFCMVLTEDDAHISSWHSNSVRARISRDVRIVSESESDSSQRSDRELILTPESESDPSRVRTWIGLAWQKSLIEGRTRVHHGGRGGS